MLLRDDDCGYSECGDSFECMKTTPSVCEESNLCVESPSSATDRGYDVEIQEQADAERCMKVRAVVMHTTPPVGNNENTNKLGQS